MDALRWVDNSLQLLDQSKLPDSVEYYECRHYQQVARAIREMRVRGAPAIGIAAAFGYVLAALDFRPGDFKNGDPEAGDSKSGYPVTGDSEPGDRALGEHLAQSAGELLSTRPTAVNLAWSLDRMACLYRAVRGADLDRVRPALLEGAQRMLDDQKERDLRIGTHGNRVIPERARILTYCNAGALATGGYGTALGAISCAHRSGKEIHVYVPETRPLLQGSRLTAWELEQAGLPYTIVTDNMAGYLFSRGLVDLVIVGADRIVANGDVANKIGTYILAVLARYHRCPFYVAAPLSTYDYSLGEGGEITVEMRDPEEVRTFRGLPTSGQDAPVLNPSFDVTPHTLVSGYINEFGVFDNPRECRDRLEFEPLR